MPTILLIGPYRFYFYSHEPNEPPHVHIDLEGCSAKIWLKTISLANHTGFAKKELNELIDLTRQHQQQFLDKENIGEMIGCGAKGVAVISAIAGACCPQTAAEELLGKIMNRFLVRSHIQISTAHCLS